MTDEELRALSEYNWPDGFLAALQRHIMSDCGCGADWQCRYVEDRVLALARRCYELGEQAERQRACVCVCHGHGVMRDATKRELEESVSKRE